MRNENEIVIYTNPDTLKHKKDRRYSMNNWYFERMPASKKIRRIYFAITGEVVGSFKVVAMGYHRIFIGPRTWRTIKSTIAIKPFRGFRYRWW